MELYPDERFSDEGVCCYCYLFIVYTCTYFEGLFKKMTRLTRMKK